MLTLYNLDGCGYCSMVRNVLDQLKMEYVKIDVPWQHSLRKEVYAVSGQYTVPVLLDGDKVFDDENEIVAYLKQTYANKTCPQT